MPNPRSTRFARLPVLEWAGRYRREYLSGDLLAGAIVAIMLVPQAMAYAMLAGLPPQIGLYSSVLPLVAYSALGTSRSLAVGPVAMVSLLVAGAIQPLSGGDPLAAARYGIVLAALVGALQLAMGFMHLGVVVNFLSHPVLSGFTSAAAIIIGFSQLQHLLGVPVERHEHFYETVADTLARAPSANPTTLAIAVGAVATLLFFRAGLGNWLRRCGIADAWIVPITRSGPLLVVLAGGMTVAFGQLDIDAGVRVVGAIPRGLPSLALPDSAPEVWRALVPSALLISFVGFMESASVARALAAKRRQRIDPDQELVALGAANLASALAGGYPVTGGFSRSVVNFAAGANTGLASLVTAGLVAVAALLLTPMFTYLPNAVLAAIIVVAVAALVDVAAFGRIWRYSRADGASLAATFLAVLVVGIELGILVGAVTAAVLHLWRTSRPHFAIVGRVGESQHFRNVLRHRVATLPHVVAVRIDESLYYANTRFLENRLLRVIADRPEVSDLLLIMSAVNFIDASALETLESLREELLDSGVRLSLAEVKGPVMDRLARAGFIDAVGPGNVYLSTFDGWQAVGRRFRPPVM